MDGESTFPEKNTQNPALHPPLFLPSSLFIFPFHHQLPHLLLVSKPLAFPSRPLSFSTLAFPPQNSEFSCISLWHLPNHPSISNFVHLILICVPRHDSPGTLGKKHSSMYHDSRSPSSEAHISVFLFHIVKVKKLTLTN